MADIDDAGRSGSGVELGVLDDTGVSAKLVGDEVQFVNGGRKVVWVFQTPVAESKSGKPVATTVSLSKARSGYVIHVAAPKPAPTRAVGASFDPETSSARTEYVASREDDVTWEGQIIAASTFYAGPNDVTGDCYVDSTTPNDSLCGTGLDYIGPDDNQLINFDVTDNLPANAEILGADVIDTVASQITSSSEEIGIWQAGDAWNDFATWNSYDGSDNWTTPGGDESGAMLSEDQVGGSGWVGANPDWDVTSAVQSWIDRARLRTV